MGHWCYSRRPSIPPSRKTAGIDAVRRSEAHPEREQLAQPAPPGVSGKAEEKPATDGQSRKTQAVQSEEVSTGPESAAKPPSALSAGSVSPDRFAVAEDLGAGAFGTVYRARDTQLDREVALKIPKMGVLGSERDAQRFLREARAAGNLRHPNIVPIYDAGRIGESYFIASGFIEGQTLSERIAGDAPLTHRESAALIQKLAGALHYAHTKGIVQPGREAGQRDDRRRRRARW